MDLTIYQRQNMGNPLGFGNRPALLIVDFVVGFTDPDLFGGGNIVAAVKRTVTLLEAARRFRIPVSYTRVVYADDGSNLGVMCEKAPRLRMLTEAHPAGQIVPELQPQDGELVVRKTQPSAFFGTELAAWLVRRQVDTLIVAGCTTSGCVRASVVDAVSWNFRPIVARDCVGDRAEDPHRANLFDMGQKYADLMDCDEIIMALEQCARGGIGEASHG